MAMISFDEFLQQARSNIDAFEKEWKEAHIKNGMEQYPMEIDKDNVGIWWEQLFEFDNKD